MFHEYYEMKSSFGGKKISIFSDLSGVLTILATTVNQESRPQMCSIYCSFTYLYKGRNENNQGKRCIGVKRTHIFLLYYITLK